MGPKSVLIVQEMLSRTGIVRWSGVCMGEKFV